MSAHIDSTTRDDGAVLEDGDEAVDTVAVAGRTKKPRNRRERGVILIWFALILVVLVGFAGFAIDLSNWWFQAERLQRAADAGAHGGVVYLPGDLPSATATAHREVRKNSFRVGGIGAGNPATVQVRQEPNPNRLRVSVRTEVPNFFLGVFGIKSTTLTREAVAEFIAPVPMGSPENKLGNDPEATDPGTQLWVNLAGTMTTKAQGDRYSNRNCDGGEYACTGSTNDEFDPAGYFFGMEVTAKGTGPLRFQAYDAPWVNVGATCDTQYTMPNSSQVSNLQAKFGAGTSTRYGSSRSGLSGNALAAAQKFCTGDSLASSASGTAVDTTFIFYKPDDTPWTHADNELVPSCPPITIPGHNPLWQSNNTNRQNYIYNLLMSPTEGVINPNDGVVTFAESWRRFATLCEIANGDVELGTYVVQVRTNARAVSPLANDPSINSVGHNKMSFRAGFGDSGVANVDGSKVTLAALGRLPIFANSTGADTRFYLARVLPYDAGRTLRIHLFDMGEAAQAGTLQIIPPEEFKRNQFSGCNISRDNGGSLSVTASTCTLSNVHSSNFNGRLLTIDVPIPNDYDCDDHLPTGCWIKVRASYAAGVTVNDATTWSAAILGNPIRLVE